MWQHNRGSLPGGLAVVFMVAAMTVVSALVTTPLRAQPAPGSTEPSPDASGDLTTPESGTEEAAAPEAETSSENGTNAVGERQAAWEETAETTRTATLSPEQIDALCILEGEAGAGSGFFLNMRGLTFAVTNIHVLAGLERFQILTLTGESVRPGPTALATGHDVAIIRVDDTYLDRSYTLVEDLNEKVRIGDPVLIPGNESGGGVVTVTEGSVRGIGPKLIEVNARFVQGNSGSPIIHVPTGTVIGVATYAVKYHTEDSLREEAGLSDTRWFGFRIDSIEGWEAVNWRRFRTEAEAFAEIEHNTRTFFRFLFEDDYSSNEEIKHAVDLVNRDLRGDPSRADVLETFKTFSMRLSSIATSDLDAFRKRPLYDYFEDRAKEHQQYRDYIVSELNDYDKRLRQLRRR